ncbi:hypothetical protein HYZ97_04165 [Candidatus Pacearchaeota archaeon]|nr:hypothetical protein [Candidatus Pacearchaeota archaeon]
MKWMLLIPLFLLLTGTHALSTNLKQVYDSQETISIKISGQVLEPLASGQIEFRRGHVLIPFEYGLELFNDEYYLWAVAPINASNYTLVIKNIATSVNGMQKTITYSQNFSITGNLTAFTVKPGVIRAQEKFTLEIISHRDEPFSLLITYPEEQTVTIKPGKNLITISAGDTSGISSISLGPYTFPVYSSGLSVSANRLVFFPEYLEDIYLPDRASPSYSIILRNTHNRSIEDIELVYTRDIFVISPDKPFTLESDEQQTLNISLRRGFNGSINEVIYARSADSSYSSSLLVRLELENGIPFNRTSNQTLFYCEELGGSICGANTICSSNPVSSLQGACCLDVCTELGDSDEGINWTGYLVAAIALVLVIIIYLRYRKTSVKSGEGMLKETNQGALP